MQSLLLPTQLTENCAVSGRRWGNRLQDFAFCSMTRLFRPEGSFWHARLISFPNDPQSFERQKLVGVLDMFRAPGEKRRNIRPVAITLAGEPSSAFMRDNTPSIMSTVP